MNWNRMKMFILVNRCGYICLVSSSVEHYDFDIGVLNFYFYLF
jgi:hypothetical protein